MVLRRKQDEALERLGQRVNQLEVLPQRVERLEDAIDVLAGGLMRAAREIEVAVGGHHGPRIRTALSDTIHALRAAFGRLAAPGAPGPPPRSIDRQIDEVSGRVW